MTEDEFAELASGHALHTLSDVDERRYDEALAANPLWAERAAAEADTAAALAEMLTPVAPPPAVRAELLARIAATPQGDVPQDEARAVVQSADDAVPSAAPRHAAAPRRRWFALAASLALLVALGVGTVAVVSQTLRPAAVIALDEIEGAPDAQVASIDLDGGARLTAHWSDSLGSAVLVTDGLDDLDSSRTYQLWYVRGEERIPAGVFDTRAGQATAALEGEMHAGDTIAVTIEPPGGSPAPTTDPVAVIPTA